jgi:myo-inositol-1(or 4)-monophosphatase
VTHQRELEVARDAAREAAEIARRHRAAGTRVFGKGDEDLVTAADLEADAAIARRLSAAFPADARLSEESAGDAARLSRSRVWIVDPLDGTREFSEGLPEFAVSIALVEAGEPAVAVVHNPAEDVAVWACRGAGTFRGRGADARGERVRVTDCTRLEQALLLASETEWANGRIEEYAGWFRAVRPVGSIAWKLACIASGQADLNLSLSPKSEWDVCGGDLLVREAGGVYVDLSGRRPRYNQPEPRIPGGMLAGRAELVAAFRSRVGEEI